MQMKNEAQLKETKLQDLQAYRTKVNAALEKAKKSTDNEQEVDALSIHLAEVDDEILSKQQAETSKPSKPVVQLDESSKNTNTEKVMPADASQNNKSKCAKLIIRRGARFNSETGEKISASYEQAFTYSEALLFAKTYKTLGYKIEKVVDNPFSNINFE